MKFNVDVQMLSMFTAQAVFRTVNLWLWIVVSHRIEIKKQILRVKHQQVETRGGLKQGNVHKMEDMHIICKPLAVFNS